MAPPIPPRLNVARVTGSEVVPTRPRQNRLAVQERRRQARRLRVAGLSVEAIALRLAADPSINTSADDEGYEGGYGWRNYIEGKEPPKLETLRSEAAEDLRVVFERSRDSIDRDNDHMFDIALERIEMVVAFASGPASRGSNQHQQRILEATDLQARMMGWHKSPLTINVDNSVHVTAESPQPIWDAEYLTKFTAAMAEAGAEPPTVIAAAEMVVAELPVTSADPDALPVDSTEA